MTNVLIASYLGAAVAIALQDQAGFTFLWANALAAPVTVAAWTTLSRAA